MKIVAKHRNLTAYITLRWEIAEESRCVMGPRDDAIEHLYIYLSLFREGEKETLKIPFSFKNK